MSKNQSPEFLAHKGKFKGGRTATSGPPKTMAPPLPIPVEVAALREHHYSLAVEANKNKTKRGAHRRLLTSAEYRFAEYFAALGSQRKNWQEILRTYRNLSHNEDLDRKALRALVSNQSFKEYVEALRRSILEAARVKAESQMLTALDYHGDAMEDLHATQDWAKLWRYTDPYVKAALPTKTEQPAVAVQINLSPAQQRLLTEPLPEIEVDAEVVDPQ